MGKSAACFRRLFCGQKTPDSREKKRCQGLIRSVRDDALPAAPPPPHLSCGTPDGGCRSEASERFMYPDGAGDDVSKHAIAVAIATATVAEAALTAAHAAAAVVRLTSGDGGRLTAPTRSPAEAQTLFAPCGLQKETAAVVIQSSFRAYLARRALRALKGLVKLQALVRGHFVRKQATDMARRMQALVRAQTRARAHRAHHSQSPPPPSISFHHDASMHCDFPFLQIQRSASNSEGKSTTPPDPWRLGEVPRSWSSRREHGGADEEANSDKILEVDTGKLSYNYFLPSTAIARTPPKRALDFGHDRIRRCGHGDCPSRPQKQSPSVPFRAAGEGDEDDDEEPILYRTERSPRGFSAGRGGRGKGEQAGGFVHGCLDHPNYMAKTESSRAKARSQSAPRRSGELENSPAGSVLKNRRRDAASHSNRDWDSRDVDYLLSDCVHRFDDKLLSLSLS